MKVLSKILRNVMYIVTKISQMLKMIVYKVPICDFQYAIFGLNEISPDKGGSCIIKRGHDFEKRSIPLSVIVPAYNVEKYICSCLDSILGQSVSCEYEIIVIDDGSTDTTPMLIEKYRLDKRVRIIHQGNNGLSSARNIGIKCSKGEYLCFVDSDDEVPAGALNILYSVANKEKAKLVIGSHANCLRDGKTRYVTRFENKKVTNMNLPGFAWCRLMHYSVFQNLCFPENYWFEDSIMAQIIHPLCCDSTYTVSNVCYHYFDSIAGITSRSNNSGKSLDSLWITMRLLDERRAFGLELTQSSYEYFLKMVNLTYHRTKHLGAKVAHYIYVIQRNLLNKYYRDYHTCSNGRSCNIEKALRSNSFRKYILACGLKRK